MTTLNVQAAASTDDGYWQEGNSNFENGANFVWVGYHSGTTTVTNSFIRFPNVTVPQGYSITTAYLTFTAYLSNSNTTVNALISAIDADNANAPTDYAGAEGATRTTASVAWDNIAAWTQDSTYNSPEIKTVIQEIVDRASWASGNALVIYLESNGTTATNNTHRSAYAWDYDSAPGNSAILHIEYAPAEPTPTADKTYDETITLRDVFSDIGGDPTEVRNHPHTAKWYMAVENPRYIWKGRVQYDRGYNQSGDVEKDLTILIHSGANEGSYDIDNFLPDLTAYIGTTDEGKDHGRCRVRSYDGYNMKVGADMTCIWKEGDYVTVTDLHEYWPVLHRVEEDGDDIVVYKDYDLDAATYLAEEPVPIMGPPACAILSAGSASVEFHGGSSYVVQPNSDEEYWVNHGGISSYAWWFEGGTPSTSTSADQTVTYSTAGRYVARLTLTGENGKTYKSFRNVFIFDATGADSPITEYTPTRVSASLSSHGWEATLDCVDDTFNPSTLPDNAQVVLFTEEWFNGTAKTTELGNCAQQGRNNIKFVGWVKSVNAQYSSGKIRSATASLMGLQELMKRETIFPVYFTMIEADPPGWSAFTVTGLTVRKVLYHLVRWHFTLMRFTDFFIPDDHNNYLPGQNFDEGSLADALDEFCPDIQSEWAVDRGGALHVFSWYNYLPISGDGAGWRTRNYLPIAFDENDFSKVSISPRVRSEVARVQVEGVECDSGGNYTWTTDTAPGNVKNYGGETILIDHQVLGTGGFEGSQGWELARSVYAEESRSIESVNLTMLGNYSMMDIVAGTSYFTLSVTPSSVLRNINWSSKPFWVTSIDLSLDVENGDIETELEAIPETYPDPDIPIYTDKDDQENQPWEPPAGGITDTIKQIAANQPRIVPALLGDGGGRVTGAEEGTSYVRLFGNLNNTVISQNRLLHDIASRPVWVQINPKGLNLPKFQVIGTRIASDSGANSDVQRAHTQHFAVFNSMTVAADGLYDAPSWVAREYTYFIKSVSAHLLVAGSTDTVVTVYLNDVSIKVVTISAGSKDSGRQTVTAGTKAEDGDVVDMTITTAGAGASGLSVQVEMWRFGV